ncbi:hypothetical protein ES703_78614 [subsurface metagenome]
MAHEAGIESDFKIELTVNNKKVGLNSFVRGVFVNVILGVVKTLKNVDEPEDIVVKIQRNR